MAERRTARRRPDYDEPAEPASRPDDSTDRDSGDRPRPSRRRAPGLTAADVAQEGMRQVAELTGKEPEGVTGVEPAEDGWLVGVELVEDRRIPSAADILATYEVEVDAGGELVSYHRVRRYARGRGDSKDT